MTGVGCGLPKELVSWLQFPDPTRLPRCFLVQQKQPRTARSGELPDGERGHLKTTHHEKRYNNHNNLRHLTVQPGISEWTYNFARNILPTSRRALCGGKWHLLLDYQISNATTRLQKCDSTCSPDFTLVPVPRFQFKFLARKILLILLLTIYVSLIFN